MTDQEFQTLEILLRKFRDDESVDREEWDNRESLRFDVAFECEARGISLLPNASVSIPGDERG
jgi:hypothetical protein